MTQTSRVLCLLGLLQSRPTWTGPELADRLGVTTRTVRRDVDRLRALGYPVRAGQGVGGGYQLGSGVALPPLLLDDEEAVAVAVSLRLAAGGTVAGLGEPAMRTLGKLDQVLPARLRASVEAVSQATVAFGRSDQHVEGAVVVIDIDAPLEVVAGALPAGIGTLSAVGSRCELRFPAWDVRAAAARLAWLPWQFRVVAPEELVAEVAALAERLAGSAGRTN